MEKTTAIAACGGGDDPVASLLLLPEDSLIQILMRLPIKSLLRFKSVCTSWCALIQTSFFIHLHSTFNSSSNFGTFILRAENLTSEHEILMLSEYEGSEYGDGYRCTDGSWHKFTGGGDDDDDYDFEEDVFDDYTVGFKDDDKDNQEEVFKADDDDQLLLKVDKLELPSGYKTYSNAIAGSCNGLICLYDFELGDVSLWNPATRQFRTLPKSITIEIDDDDLVQSYGDFIAFGFDVKSKDHKVLLIKKFGSQNMAAWPQKVVCRVQVYSSSTDSWRLFEGGINSLPGLPNEHGVYLNGSCFFLANVYHPESNTYNRFINSFDFTKEIFTTMQLPDQDFRRRLFLDCLGGEKMALFTTLRMRPMKPFYQYDSDCSNDADGPSYEYDSDCSKDSYGYEDCDIWVLNEQHGGGVNKESWTKLHSFQIRDNKRGRPIGISNNGKFAFLDTTETSYEISIRLYNLVTKEVKLDIPFCVSTSKVYVYKPSLVSILGGNGAAAVSPVIG